MSNWYNESTPYDEVNYNRDKIDGRRRRVKFSLLLLISVFFSLALGLAIGFMVLKISGKPTSLFMLVLSFIGGIFAAALTYIPPIWSFIVRNSPRLREEFKTTNKILLVSLNSVIIVVVLLCSFLISNRQVVLPFLKPGLPSYLPPKGILVLNNSLNDNTNNDYRWEESAITRGSVKYSCQFIEGAYHASESGRGGLFTWCKALQTDFKNFAFVVDMNIQSGKYGGVFIRARNLDRPFMYFCFIFKDGAYQLGKIMPNHSERILEKGHILGYQPGQSNTIAILAQDSEIALYVNGLSIDSIDDSTYSHGIVGVMSGENSDVAFSNAEVWSYS